MGISGSHLLACGGDGMGSGGCHFYHHSSSVHVHVVRCTCMCGAVHARLAGALSVRWRLWCHSRSHAVSFATLLRSPDWPALARGQMESSAGERCCLLKSTGPIYATHTHTHAHTHTHTLTHTHTHTHTHTPVYSSPQDEVTPHTHTRHSDLEVIDK